MAVKAASVFAEIGAKLDATWDALPTTVGAKMGKVSTSLAATAVRLAPIALAVGAVGKAALDASIEFESAFTGVLKTVDDATDEFGNLTEAGADLRRGILDMSTVMPASASAIAGVAEAAGQLGIRSENLLGFTRVMVDLGETTNLSADEAATALARLANVTGMPQTAFDRLGSTIVALGNSFATTEREIVEFAGRLSGAGTIVGLSEADILALGTALSSVGINAEAGGTAFSKVMIQIAQASRKGGDELEMFARVAGVSAKDFALAFERDPAGAIVAFVKGLGKIEEQGGNTFDVLEQLGVTEQRMRDALLRTAGASDVLAGALGVGREAWAANNALTKEANLRYGTTASKLEIVKNKAVALAVGIGDGYTPALRVVLDLSGAFLDLARRIQGAEAAMRTDNVNKLTAAWGGLWQQVTNFLGIQNSVRGEMTGFGPVIDHTAKSVNDYGATTGHAGRLTGLMEQAVKSSDAQLRAAAEAAKEAGEETFNFGTSTGSAGEAAREAAEKAKKWADAVKDSGKALLKVANDFKPMVTASESAEIRLVELRMRFDEMASQAQAALSMVPPELQKVTTAAGQTGQGLLQIGDHSQTAFQQLLGWTSNTSRDLAGLGLDVGRMAQNFEGAALSALSAWGPFGPLLAGVAARSEEMRRALERAGETIRDAFGGVAAMIDAVVKAVRAARNAVADLGASLTGLKPKTVQIILDVVEGAANPWKAFQNTVAAIKGIFGAGKSAAEAFADETMSNVADAFRQAGAAAAVTGDHLGAARDKMRALEQALIGMRLEGQAGTPAYRELERMLRGARQEAEALARTQRFASTFEDFRAALERIQAEMLVLGPEFGGFDAMLDSATGALIDLVTQGHDLESALIFLQNAMAAAGVPVADINALMEILRQRAGGAEQAVDDLASGLDGVKQRIGSDPAANLRAAGDAAHDLGSEAWGLEHALGGLRNALQDAAGAVDALARAAQDLKDSRGTGTLSSGVSLPGFAAGGPVAANQTILVGEEGPELFVPASPGVIVPSHGLPAGGGGGGGGGGTQHITVYVGNEKVAEQVVKNFANTAMRIG